MYELEKIPHQQHFIQSFIFSSGWTKDEDHHQPDESIMKHILLFHSISSEWLNTKGDAGKVVQIIDCDFPFKINHGFIYYIELN